MSLYSLWLQWQGHLNLPPVFILDISGNYKHTQGKFTLLFIKKSLLLLWFSSGQGKNKDVQQQQIWIGILIEK